MRRRHTEHIFFTIQVALLFLLTAYSVPSVTSSSPIPMQTQQNSSVAMSKLNSVHFDLQQASLRVQPNDAKSGITFSVTGHGDASTPDLVPVKFTSEQKSISQCSGLCLSAWPNRMKSNSLLARRNMRLNFSYSL